MRLVRRQIAWSGATLIAASGLAAVLAATMLFPSAVFAPDTGCCEVNSTSRAAALLLLALELAGFGASISAWLLLSLSRVNTALRITLFVFVLQLAAVAVAAANVSTWKGLTTGESLVAVLPRVFLGTAVVAFGCALVALRAQRVSLAKRRAGDAATIAGYLARLDISLRTTPRRKARILSEVAEHLRDSAAKVGETEATARFGKPDELAETFTSETLVANARLIAWSALAASAVWCAVLISFVKRLVGVDQGWYTVLPTGVVWDRTRSPQTMDPLTPIESLGSPLSSIPPPLRGGLAITVVVAALLGLVLAVAAVLIARSRARLAAALSALSLGEAVLAGIPVVLFARGGYRDYSLHLPSTVVWLFGVTAVLVAAAIWCELELAPRRAPTVRTSAIALTALAIPLVIGIAWRAPNPPQTGLSRGWAYGVESGYVAAIPRGSASSQVALVRKGRHAVIAWVGYTVGTDADGNFGAKSSGANAQPVALRVSSLSGLSEQQRQPAERPLAVIRSPAARDIRALAVSYIDGKPVLAYGTGRGLFLWSGNRSPSLLASGAVSGTRFARVGSRLSLVAIVDGRVVRADSPKWRISAPIGRSDGRTLSVEGGRTLTVLWSDEGKLRLVTDSGRPLTIASSGSGVLGRLDRGRLAVAYAGFVGGRYGVHVDTLVDGRLRAEVVENNLPCARPIALGTRGKSTKVYLSSRCPPLAEFEANAAIPTDYLVPAQELERRRASWRLTTLEPYSWEAASSGDNRTVLFVYRFQGQATQIGLRALDARTPNAP